MKNRSSLFWFIVFSSFSILFFLFMVFKVLFHNQSVSEAKPETTGKIIEIILPHHDLVKDIRQDFWQEIIAQQELNTDIKHVVIISPNHFGVIQDKITYDPQPWQLKDNEFQTGEVGQLAELATKRTFLVKHDHGIMNLVGEIGSLFPTADFVPLLIGQETELTELEAIIDWLDLRCQFENCAIVASVDFSHYMTQAESDFLDARTLQVLENKGMFSILDIKPDERITVDSPQTIYIIQELARRRNLDWHFYAHTNSAFGSQAITATTSHFFGGYW